MADATSIYISSNGNIIKNPCNGLIQGCPDAGMYSSKCPICCSAVCPNNCWLPATITAVFSGITSCAVGACQSFTASGGDTWSGSWIITNFGLPASMTLTGACKVGVLEYTGTFPISIDLWYPGLTCSGTKWYSGTQSAVVKVSLAKVAGVITYTAGISINIVVGGGGTWFALFQQSVALNGNGVCMSSPPVMTNNITTCPGAQTSPPSKHLAYGGTITIS